MPADAPAHSPLHYGWLDSNEVLAWLEAHKPPMLHLIITGRYAPQNLIVFADLVTEMRAVKHPLPNRASAPRRGLSIKVDSDLFVHR